MGLERRWQVLIVSSTALFVSSLDLFIVNIAFPEIEREFAGTGVASVSWVLNAYAIVYAALLVAAGRLADRAGRRRMFITGLAVFVLGSALCGAAPSIGALVAARVLQAVGAACLVPTSLALLLPEFTPAQRPAAIGVWAAIGGVAAALGPVLGGILVQQSWRLVFLVNIPVGALALAAGARVLAESRDDSPQARPDLLGAAVLMASVAIFALGLVKAPAWGWSDTRTLACLLAGAIGAGAFWRRCRRHPSPIVDPSMLAVRSFAAANGANLAFSAGFAAFLLADVLFLTRVWGEPALTAGLAVAPGPMLASVFAANVGRVVNRFGQRALASVGIALFGLGCAWWLLRMGREPDYAGEMLPGLVLTGVGVGFVLPTLASASATSLPPARFATGSALFSMSRQLGFVLGVAALVAVLGADAPAEAVRAFDRGWLFMIATSALALAAALSIGELRPARAAAPAPVAPAPATPAAPEAAGSRGCAGAQLVAAGTRRAGGGSGS